MDSLSLPSFSKKRHPLLRQKTRCHSILRIIIKFHSPLCRNTEYQCSFPGLSEHGISMFIPRFIGIRNIKFHSPVSRITEVYSNSVFSSVIPNVSGPEMSPIKCLFLQTISLQIHFKNSSNVYSRFYFLSYCYQHGSGQSFSPVKLQYLLAELDPFLQRIWVSLFIQNKSSLSFHIHNYITSIHNILSQKWCTCI